MLEFLVPFIVYVLAFAAGSFVAVAVARQKYPATTEREALAELDARLATDGGPR